MRCYFYYLSSSCISTLVPKSELSFANGGKLQAEHTPSPFKWLILFFCPCFFYIPQCTHDLFVVFAQSLSQLDMNSILHWRWHSFFLKVQSVTLNQSTSCNIWQVCIFISVKRKMFFFFSIRTMESQLDQAMESSQNHETHDI